MNQKKLGELIEKAAKSNQLPEINRVDKPHSPGFLNVMLCGVLVEDFDTYYYSAQEKAHKLRCALADRINNCASNLIKQQAERIERLENIVKRLTDAVAHFNKTHGDMNPLLEAYTDALKDSKK